MRKASTASEVALLKKQMAEVLLRLSAAEAKGAEMAKTLAQYAAELADLSARTALRAAELTAEVTAIKADIEGKAAQLAALKQQVDELIAGGGADAAVLEPTLVKVAEVEVSLAASLAALRAVREANA